jgi:hypothetical protein
MYPTDGKAGGTWIAARSNGDTIVLLNGAMQNHKRQSRYRISRGQVVLGILDHPSMVAAFENTNLHDIEPFTLVMCQQGMLFAGRWNGATKHIESYDALVPHIWSSATLYTSSMQHKRKRWFEHWYQSGRLHYEEGILQFHLQAGDNDDTCSIRMHRPGSQQTVSISQLSAQAGHTIFSYHDLINHASSTHQLLHTSAIGAPALA